MNMIRCEAVVSSFAIECDKSSNRRRSHKFGIVWQIGILALSFGSTCLGQTPYPVASALQLSFACLSFQCEQPISKSLLVSSSSAQQFEFVASTLTDGSASWLTLNGAPATTQSTPAIITVTANAATLTIGQTYFAVITLVNANNPANPQSVFVSFETLQEMGSITCAPAQITATPQTISLQGTSSTSLALTYTNPECGTLANPFFMLNLAAAAGPAAQASWLSVSTSSGSLPLILTIYANAAGLSEGVYKQLLISFLEDGASQTGAYTTVEVDMNVSASTPSVGNTSPFSPTAAATAQTIGVTGSDFESGLTVTLTAPNGSTTTLSGSQIHNVSATSFQMMAVLSSGGQYSFQVTNPDGGMSAPFYFMVAAAFPVQPTSALPIITTLSPSSATSGTAFTLTVKGSNFVSGATVLWNATPLSTTFVSSTQLAAPVSASLTASSGTVSITVSSGGQTSAPASFTISPPASSSGSYFVSVTPCRLVDTRNPDGSFGGPPITGGTSRDFAVPSTDCGIPSTATAYSLNVAVVPHGPLGFLTIWPTGQPQPLVSTLNSDGRVKSNAAIVPAGLNGSVSVYATDTTDLVVDIDGYFLSGSSSGALAFYPMTPCRIADTRNAGGVLGGPSLMANSIRGFPILSSACDVSTTAQAYSLNFTAVPDGTLGYLTVWPSGQPQPLASSLNDPTGTVAANAVIIPAGPTGEVEVYSTDNTDLVIDVNGYFSFLGLGGLSLYTLQPCRVLDTRQSPGTPISALTVDVQASPCGVPASAQAYVFNATVVPEGFLGYLVLWPDGQPQPLASTLNAWDGAITSNMAIVPTANGSISVFASQPTHLILDISGYFAP
jgi:hypothetical protein